MSAARSKRPAAKKKNPAQLWIAAETLAPAVQRFCGGELCVFIRPYLDQPASSNGDSIAVSEAGSGSGVIVLADGAGGTPSGNLASGMAVREMIKAVRPVGAGKSARTLRDRILDGFEAANRVVLKRLPKAASTLFTVEVTRQGMRAYHAGDSLALLVDAKGKVRFRTVAHSPVGYAFEAGLLSERAALLHPDNHLVQNMLGTQDMRIEVGATLAMAPGDTLLLCSDGLSDNLTVTELLPHLRGLPLEQAARKIVEACTQRMLGGGPATPSKHDDLSFVLYRR